MRVLLDECVPRSLKSVFADHEVRTVQEMGWGGRRNGALMTMINASDFQVFITVDRNLQYQQDMKRMRFGMIVLKAVTNRRADLAPLAEQARMMIESFAPGQVRVIEPA